MSQPNLNSKGQEIKKVKLKTVSKSRRSIFKSILKLIVNLHRSQSAFRNWRITQCQRQTQKSLMLVVSRMKTLKKMILKLLMKKKRLMTISSRFWLKDFTVILKALLLLCSSDQFTRSVVSTREFLSRIVSGNRKPRCQQKRMSFSSYRSLSTSLSRTLLKK